MNPPEPPFAFEQRGFFKYVWRFNAIAIGVAAVMGIVIMFPGVMRRLQEDESSRPHRARNTVDVALMGTEKEQWRLGGPMRIRELGDVTMIPLESYYDRWNSARRNFLLVDNKADSTRWLLPTNNYLIAETRHTSVPRDNRDILSTPFLYHIVKEDTNGDGNLSVADKGDLLVSRTDGMGSRLLANDVERLQQSSIIDDVLFVIYQKDGVNVATRLRLPDLEILETRPLPTLEEVM